MTKYNYIFDFLKNSQVIYLVLNTDRVYIEGNDAFFDTIEAKDRNLSELNLRDFIHREDISFVRDALEEVRSSKSKDQKLVHRIVSQSGKVKTLSWNLSWDENEQVWIGLATDISDHSFEANIFKQAQVQGKIGTWKYDLSSDELKWSDESFKIYELSQKGQISIKRIKNFFREESLQKFEKAFEEALKKATPFDIELDIISGKFRPTKIRMIANIEAHDETVTGIYGTIQDITDLRQIERKASDYQEAIDKSSIVDISDRHGKITHVNERFLEVSGYTKEELIGESYTMIKSNFHPEAFWKKLWSDISNGKIWSGEICNKKKNGSDFWVRTTIVPFKNASGRIYQYVSIRSDITETKKLNEELMVSEKLSSIGEVSAQILHEVMNPLSVISLCLDELEFNFEEIDEGSETHKKIFKLINNIQTSYDRIDEIFENMRSILVQKDGQRPKSINIETVFNKTLSLISNKVKGGKINLDLSGINKDHNVITTESDFSQVILNLLNNSCDAISQFKEKWITVSSIAENGKVKIILTDSGPGIPEEVATRIFDSLFTTKGSDKGTGLGMGVCKKLIERYSGRIYLDQENKNTTFIVELPQSEEAASNI